MPCHEYGRAAEIKFALKDTDALIEKVDQELVRVHKLGFATDEMQGALFDLRNRFHRVFHSVDVDRVRKETDGFRAELTAIEDGVKEIDMTIGQRKLWGSVVIGLFFAMGVVLLLVRKTYEEEE